MLLPEKKEREYRFKLALRIALPIFALVVLLISSTLIGNYETLHTSFFIESILLIAFSIYFTLYILYNGFDEKITDSVSKSFTRDYLLKYLEQEIQKEKEYTLILISITNLHDINKQYGLQNGDKVLFEVAHWIGENLTKKDIHNAPIGHLKGGDFIVGLRGDKSKYSSTMDMMCIRASELHIDSIEINIAGAIVDTNYSKDLQYLIENLFEQQEQNIKLKYQENEENIDPNELESLVLEAVKNREVIVSCQNVYSDKEVAFCEIFTKLKTSDGRYFYPKKYQKILKKIGLMFIFEKMILEMLLLEKTQRKFALHISAASLRNEKFLHEIKILLQSYKEQYDEIIFIISEQEYYSFTKRFNAIIQSLKADNIRIAVDKLGVYHSSFLYFKELEIDIVIYDTSYSHLQKLQQQHYIIEGFELMTKEKGVQTWMRNIESKEVAAEAKKLGINYIQGKELSTLMTL